VSVSGAEASKALAKVFRDHAQVPVALPPAPEELEVLLSERVGAAGAAWPGVEISAGRFVRHLAGRLPEAGQGRPLAQVLDGLAVPELYLACACGDGVPLAAEILEREYLARLPGILARQFPGISSATVEEVRQVVREELLMGSSKEAGPRILTYRGEGELFGWIKIIALRKASRLLPARQDGPVEPDLLPHLTMAGDQEETLIRGELQDKLREAVREAVRAVTSRDQRYLLRLHYRDRLSTVELVKLFGTSQPTISRKIQRIRESILAETKRLMREQHGIGEQELRAFLADASRIDLTLSAIFDSRQAPGQD